MGVALIASLIVSAALAVWMLIQTLSGSSVESVPRAGERIDASFAGLRDTRGAAVDEHALATRYRLVTFGFTTCPNVCPLTLMGVHQALEQLGPDAAPLDGKSGSYVVEHSAFLLLVDPQQRIRVAIPSTAAPAEIAARIVRAVRESAQT